MAARYDKIGAGYNLTRKADPYLLQKMIQYLSPQKEKIYLDVGCGTGNYTCELQKTGGKFIGIDPSAQMLDIAKSKNNQIQWYLGKAEQLPLKEESVDGVICSLTIHHWNSLEKGFKEIHRVSKSQSKLVLFTSDPQQMNAYWLNHYFPKMLEDSCRQMPNLNEVIMAIEKAAYQNITTAPFFIQPDIQDLFLYAGKHNPALYLNPQVRSGISSFSLLSNQVEVENGLAALKEDIQTGKIEEVIKDYQNEDGDYIFVLAEK